MSQVNVLKMVKKPTYKQGGFLVLKGIEEKTSEYDSNTTYEFEVYVKSETALNRLKKICWNASVHQTSQYGALYKATVRVEGMDCWKLENTFGETYLKDEFKLHCCNYYDDYEYWTTVYVPSFECQDPNINEYTPMGSTADGCSLGTLFKNMAQYPILG